MQPERWEQIRQLLESALERDPGERTAFLDAACGSDEPLRAEVASLLVSHEKAGEFTGAGAFEDGMRLIEQGEIASLAGRRIGNYRIVREIGRGGMGAVYQAARADDAFRKDVAIKLIKRGLDTEDSVRRFRSERQILASLDHPNISRLLDGGTTEDGLPYLVMEYIQGEPIDQYADARKLGITARLHLFQSVCAAVHYAHQNLVIHRDIKPGNVLVTAEGVPRLLDFGIAKLLLPERSSEAAGATVTSVHLMTPEFASPEQVRGEAITTASDVYSLGVLLYVLLSGRRPYKLDGLTAAGIERAICVDEPEKPSAAAVRGELRRRLHGDLDNIVLMAMHKEPGRRYGSVEHLSEDIRRHLEGLPVMARPDSPGYRAAKFAGRHKAGVAAAVLVLLTLVAGVVATSWQARVAARAARIAAAERDQARVEKAKAERINGFLQDMLGFADPSWSSPNPRKNPDAKVSEVVEQAAGRAEIELANQPDILAETERTIGNVYFGLAQGDQAEHLLRAAMEKQIELYGKDHSEVARTSYNLAYCLMKKGNVAEAETLFRGALETYRREVKGGNLEIPALPATLGGLGSTLLGKGDARQAEACFREALQYAPRMTGNTRALAGLLRNNLAGVLYARGDLREIEGLLRAAIDDYRSLPGHEYTELATSLGNLGAVLTREGRYGEAETLLNQGLDMNRKLLGAKHPFTAGAQVALAELLYYRGDYDAAARTIEDALRIYSQTIPKGHVIFCGAFRVYGLVLNRTGKSREAERHLRQAIEIRTRFQPNGQEALALLDGALGECLTTQKRYAEAEPLLLRSYMVIKPGMRGHDLWATEANRRLATLYDSWGKPVEAERYRASLSQLAAKR